MEILTTTNITSLGNGAYEMDFGNLFMGRQMNESILTLTLQHGEGSPTANYDMAFEVEVSDDSYVAINPDVNTKTSRVAAAPLSGIVPANGTASIKINLLNKKFGTEGGAGNEPVITVRFPEIVNNDSLQQTLPSELSVTVKWDNKLVIAQIDSDATTRVDTVGNFSKYRVRAKILAGTIPAGEYLPMEIMVEDDFQRPSARILFANDGTIVSDGDWYFPDTGQRIDGDQPDPGGSSIRWNEPVKKGRQGIIVHFDARSGALSQGDVSTDGYCWVYRKDPDGNIKSLIDADFGEHSSRGIYSLNSYGLDFGSAPSPIDFSIYGVRDNIDDSDPTNISPTVKVTWYALKTLSGKPDSNISIVYALPSKESGADGMKYLPYGIALVYKGQAISEGVFELGSENYVREDYNGSNSYTITPLQIPNNPENVNWVNHANKTITIPELPATAAAAILPPKFNLIQSQHGVMSHVASEVGYQLQYNLEDKFNWVKAYDPELPYDLYNEVSEVNLSLVYIKDGGNLKIVSLDGELGKDIYISDIASLPVNANLGVDVWLRMDVDHLLEQQVTEVDPDTLEETLVDNPYYFEPRYAKLAVLPDGVSVNSLEWTTVAPGQVIEDTLVATLAGVSIYYIPSSNKYYASGTVDANVIGKNVTVTLPGRLKTDAIAYSDLSVGSYVTISPTGRIKITGFKGDSFTKVTFKDKEDIPNYIEKVFPNFSLRYDETNDVMLFKGQYLVEQIVETVIGSWSDVKGLGNYDYFELAVAGSTWKFYMKTGQLTVVMDDEADLPGFVVDTESMYMLMKGRYFETIPVSGGGGTLQDPAPQ